MSDGLNIKETLQPDCLRLALVGELDLATGQMLAIRLRELRTQRTTVRLDLSNLAFMDCTGLHVITHAVDDAQEEGQQLTVDRKVSPQVNHLFSVLVGAELGLI